MIGDTSTPRGQGYEQFFGFSEPPFSLSANPRFRFPSAAHEEALLQVMYALQRREPVIVVTGDIGLGKTLLCRTVLERLPRKTFLSVINDPLLGRDDLLQRILEDFGLISAEHAGAVHASRHDLARTMTTFLASLARLDAHAVVIIDEAQHVQPDVLEQIRLLANTGDDRGTLLQIVLVGQSSLQELLAKPELRQLRQRVTRSVTLSALTGDEVRQYVAHRLAVAREAKIDSPIPGARDLAREVAAWNESSRPVAFTEEAIQAAARISRGVPRLVNVICDRALEVAFGERSRTVDTPAIRTAARLLQLDAPADEAAAVGHEAAAAPDEAAAAVDDSGDASYVDALNADASRADASHSRRYVAAAAAVVIAGALVWFGVHAVDRGRSVAPDTAGAPTQPHEAPIDVVPASAPPTSVPPASAPPAAPETSQSGAVTPAATPNPSAAGAAADPTSAFEIVIASFRTEARATEVVNQLTALGQRAHQRSIGEWQQVVAGPFASQSAAEDAQRQLDAHGFTGTHIGRAAP